MVEEFMIKCQIKTMFKYSSILSLHINDAIIYEKIILMGY